MIGTSMSFVLSDYEAEAAPKKPKPLPPNDEPISATLAKLDKYHDQLVGLNSNMIVTVDGIETNPGFTFDETVDLLFALEKIEAEAEDILNLAENVVIP